MTTGFTPDTIRFLLDLRENNNKTWFTDHREAFDRHVLNPMAELVGELGPAMLDIDPDIETRPLVGKTIARVHRDTRFSRDKSPYRTNLWFSFKRLSKNWQENPAFFFDLGIEQCHYGMGFYAASRATMDNLRARIDDTPEAFWEATAPARNQNRFTLAGEMYKKSLNPTLTPELADWYQRKTLYFMRREPVGADHFGPGFASRLREDFATLAPLYQLFWALRDGSWAD
ncbi:MAG: DUF2461 domain-containing protein [Magnetococcales bacterium]|nr:DUF2461 domain-containing protein [Magnetococcales bacterium]